MAGEIGGADDYATKLAKLLPAEGTAALLAINRIIPDGDNTDAFWVEVLAGVIAVFVVLWAWRVRKIRNWLQISILLVAYVVWAMSIIWDRIAPSYQGLDKLTWLPAAFAIIVALFAPLVVPSSDRQP